MSNYTLYIANRNYSSWSLRPWLLMTELQIPFTEILVPFEASNHANFSRFSPTARVPCLHDGDTVIWDSLAIIEYLAEGHAGVWPQERSARAWARSAAAEMHSGFSALRNQCSMNCGLRLRLHSLKPTCPVWMRSGRTDWRVSAGHSWPERPSVPSMPSTPRWRSASKATGCP